MLPEEEVNRQISLPPAVFREDKVQSSTNDIVQQESQLNTLLSV